jgi:hypothetical protein
MLQSPQEMEKLYPFKDVQETIAESQKYLQCQICNSRFQRTTKTVKKTYVQKKLRTNVRNPTHFESIKSDSIASSIKRPMQNPKKLGCLLKNHRLLHTLGLSNTAPFAYPRIMDLLRICGANVRRWNSRKTATTVNRFIA